MHNLIQSPQETKPSHEEHFGVGMQAPQTRLGSSVYMLVFSCT